MMNRIFAGFVILLLLLTGTGFVFLSATPAWAQLDGNFTTGGGIVVGDSTTTCDAAAKGGLRFNATSNIFEFCNGTSWGAISSGGTPGGANTQVQYNSSGAFAGSANLVWDNANSVLGIGTSGPSAALHIYKDANSYVVAKVENPNTGTAAGAAVVVKGSSGKFGELAHVDAGGSNSALFDVPNSVYISTGGGDSGGLIFTSQAATAPILFSTGGGAFSQERLRIDSTGNVGIGTTSPAALLDVEGGFYQLGGNGDANESGSMTIGDALKVALYLNGTALTSQGYANADINGDGFVDSLDMDLIPRVTGGLTTLADAHHGVGKYQRDRAISVRYGGNVGIGTLDAAVAEKLEVNGNIKLSGGSPTYKITNVATPTASSDVATKAYVDAAGGAASNGMAAAAAWINGDEQAIVTCNAGTRIITAYMNANGYCMTAWVPVPDCFGATSCTKWGYAGGNGCGGNYTYLAIACSH